MICRYLVISMVENADDVWVCLYFCGWKMWVMCGCVGISVGWSVDMLSHLWVENADDVWLCWYFCGWRLLMICGCVSIFVGGEH